MKKGLFVVVFSALLAACGGTGVAPGGPPGPGGPVPAGLAGRWYTGTILNIQFYDPVSGSWADPNGEGFYFIFNPDGTYEEGAVISSTDYTCSLRLLGRAVGTFAATADTLTLYQHERRTQVANTCSGDNKAAVMRFQVETTVREHLEKELRVGRLPEGQRLKVPSLFFIDRVANYDDEDGKIRRWFVEAYTKLVSEPIYAALNLPPVEKVHNGYFVTTSKGQAKDTTGNTRLTMKRTNSS